MEHRWGFRYPIDMSVRLERPPNLLVPAKLRNLSSSGAYVETRAALALDCRVLLELGCRQSPSEGRCRVPAHVVRKDERGIGVEWCEFAPRPVLSLLAAVRQADIFEPRQDRAASQALPPVRKRRPAARADAWPSRPVSSRSTAAHV